MGTFNDLSRVMEDTIRVDMKKRWTPQEVKFINNKNEYFGTFHGKVESTGATLANVELSNATIYDERGEKIRLNDLLALNGRVDNAEGNIDALCEDVVDLSIDVQSLKSSSPGITDELEKETEDRKYEDAQLDKKITAVGNSLSNALDSEISNRIDADENIDSRITEEVKNLNDTIEANVKAVNDRIDEEVGEINDTIVLSVDTLLSAIANDRHYRIVNVSTADRNYVLKDFAINNIEDVVSNGEVFHDDIAIGKITDVKRDADGKITSISIATLRDFDDKDIEHCLPPNAATYTLTQSKDDTSFQVQIRDGYYMSFKQPKDSTDLEKCTFDLDSHRTGGCDVLHNGEIVGAVVDDSYGTDGNLLSGRLELVPNPSSALSAFNGQVFSFNDKRLEYVFEGPGSGLSSKIVVVPGMKAVTLKQNFSASEAIPLRNSLCGDVEVGRIDFGEISKDSITARITKNVVESLTGTYVLSGEKFSVDIDEDNTIAYADSKIRICRKHNLFEYKTFSGTGAVTDATVIPNLENRVLGDGTFDEISVVVAEGEIPSFEAQTIVLKRDDNFTTTLKNDNTATVSFNEADNTLKVDVAFVKGATFSKSYSVNKDERTMVENPSTIIVETQNIDVEHPAYEKSETSGEKVWQLDIGDHQKKEYTQYHLSISTVNAGKMTLEFPKGDLEKNVSREFIARINLHGSTGFVELVIADDVELDNRDREDLFVKGNETSTIQFRQVGYKNGKPLYLVEDLKEHDLTHFIEELHKEIENRKEVDTILDGKISANTENINLILKRIDGIVNYKGSLVVDKDYSGDELQSGFAKMLMGNGLGGHDVLSAGWFYLVESSEEPLYKHTIDGVKVGKGDYLKIENSVVVEEIKSSDVQILDTLDGDVVHLDDLCAVSSDLDSKINTEKTNITNMSAYVDSICADIQSQVTANDKEISDITLSVGNLSGLLGTTATSCNVLNGRVDNLCVAISSDVITLSTQVRDLCVTISTDVNTLSGDFHKIADYTFETPASELSSHITSYNLIITDEDHKKDPNVHDKYYLTFRDGTLVLVKKED